MCKFENYDCHTPHTKSYISFALLLILQLFLKFIYLYFIKRINRIENKYTYNIFLYKLNTTYDWVSFLWVCDLSVCSGEALYNSSFISDGILSFL